MTGARVVPRVSRSCAELHARRACRTCRAPADRGRCGGWVRRQWTLRNTGAYLFGAQIMMSTCMFIMICTYMIMGFVRVDTSGDGVAAWGTYPYPKTGFLPFGSTVSALRSACSWCRVRVASGGGAASHACEVC